MLNPDMVFLLTCKSRGILFSAKFTSTLEFNLDSIVVFDVFVGRSSALAISWMDELLRVEGRDIIVALSAVQVSAADRRSKIAQENSGKPE